MIVALRWIEFTFGAGVADIVSRVTNPVLPPGLSVEEKNASYLNHFVERVAGHAKALIVKCAALADNAGSLFHHIGLVAVTSLFRRATKYEPVLVAASDALVVHSRNRTISKDVASNALMAMQSALETMKPILEGDSK